MNERELLALKERIDQAKSKVSELKGHQQYQMKELEQQWGCNSIEKAKSKIEDNRNEIEQFDQKIDRGTRELEEKYDV